MSLYEYFIVFKLAHFFIFLFFACAIKRNATFKKLKRMTQRLEAHSHSWSSSCPLDTIPPLSLSLTCSLVCCCCV